MYYVAMSKIKTTANNTASINFDQLPCLNLSLRKATRVLNKIYDQYLEPCGLKTGQFSILRVLHKTGESTNKKLQSILILDQTTLTRNLKPLIRDGYILISPGADRRQKNMRLSKLGESTYQQAHELWLQAQQQVYGQIGERQSKQILMLNDILVKLQ